MANIVIIISSLKAGGAERFISYLSRYLIEQNFSVSIITFQNNSIEPFYQLHEKVNVLNIGMSSASSDSFYQRALNLFRRLRFIRKYVMKCLVEVDSNTVVLALMSSTNIATLISLFGCSVPVLVSERTDPIKHKLPLLLRLLQRMLYRRAKKVILQTNYAQKCYPYLANTYVIGNPIPEVSSEFQVEEHANRIIAIGRLSPEKGHDILIKAFSLVIQKIPDVKLYIIGDGKEKLKLESLIRDLSLTQSVSLLGHQKNVFEHLSNSDVFVLPSYYEGFPNTLCEAMALGVPVIATAMPCLNDIIEDNVNGKVVPIGDSVALSRQIISLLNSYEERKRLSQQARKVSKKYSMSSIGNSWVKLISSLAV